MSSFHVLEDNATDMFELLKENMLKAVCGRKDEILLMKRILIRMQRNNIILVGERGIGKSSIVSGLVRYIWGGGFPEENVMVFHCCAEEFAKKDYKIILENIFSEVQKLKANVVLFFDNTFPSLFEAVQTIQAKPMTGGGHFRCILETLPEIYRGFKKSHDFYYFFEEIFVDEPSRKDTISILTGHALRELGRHHRSLTIGYTAIVAAVEMSHLYKTECRVNPQRALQLLDDTCAYVTAIKLDRDTEYILELDDEIHRLKDEKLALERDGGEEWKSRIIIAEYEIKRLTTMYQNLESNVESTPPRFIVKREQVEELVRLSTTETLAKESSSGYRDKLRERLLSRIVGQDEAVELVVSALWRAKVAADMGFEERKRPIGSFLFLGTSGVGKTELAKAVAKEISGDESKIIRFDMSEFTDSHSVAKLIGAPPGYKGFKIGGQLTEAVSRRPLSVVLFNEVEKAHSSIFNALLQVLDDGRLTDGLGKTVCFEKTIIFLTSNLGAEFFQKAASHQIDLSYAIVLAKDEVKKKFLPEFLNRVDHIVAFNPLLHDQLMKISKLHLNEFAAKYNIDVQVTEDAIKHILTRNEDPVSGARQVKKWLDIEVEQNVFKMFEKNEIGPDSRLRVEVPVEVDGGRKLSYSIEKKNGEAETGPTETEVKKRKR